MERFVYLLSVILVLCSCTAERQNGGNVFAIDYDEDEYFDWNAMVQLDEVIPLETNDSCLLSYADKCEFGKDKIVYNDSKQRALFVFDGKGKFLYKIDALGGGDKEYSQIKDVIISRDGNRILILDQTSILVFDLATGAYRDRLSLGEEVVSSFDQLAEGEDGRLYFWSMGLENSLYVLNENGHFSALKERRGFPYASQKFYRDDSGRLNLISDYGQYEVEAIVGDSVQQKYSFDFGPWAFPADKKVRTGTEWEKAEEEPYFKSLLSVFETKDALYVRTASPRKKLYNIAISKETSKVVCGNQSEKDPVGVMGSDATFFYGMLYPAYIEEDTPLSNLLRKYNVQDDDNPVIIKFRFKFE